MEKPVKPVLAKKQSISLENLAEDSNYKDIEISLGDILREIGYDIGSQYDLDKTFFSVKVKLVNGTNSSHIEYTDTHFFTTTNESKKHLEDYKSLLNDYENHLLLERKRQLESELETIKSKLKDNKNG